MIVAFLLPPTWMLYFACGVGFLDSTSTTVMRSMIISVVPLSEIGKVFGVVEFFKTVLSLIGPIIYGKLYEYTVRTDPATFLYLSSAVKVSVFVVALLIYIQLGKRENLKKQEKQDKYSHKKDDQPIRYEDTEESEQNASTDSFVRKETERPLST
jgi:MFS family permease